jgi:hypothetical protein
LFKKDTILTSKEVFMNLLKETAIESIKRLPARCTIEILSGMIPNLKVEILELVLARGLPTGSDLGELDRLADAIAKKHRDNGMMCGEELNGTR